MVSRSTLLFFTFEVIIFRVNLTVALAGEGQQRFAFRSHEGPPHDRRKNYILYFYFGPLSERRYTSNLQLLSDDLVPLGTLATRQWYDEVQYYVPGLSGGTADTTQDIGHFTQVRCRLQLSFDVHTAPLILLPRNRLLPRMALGI